jgi:AbrB family looped-hinge helix DNA binding protein
MADTLTIQMGQRGVIVLPKSLRESYNLKPGDSITIIDLDGALMLSPKRSEIESLVNQMSEALIEQGETLESMLQALREERERRVEHD